jgi:hypothetical protein
VYLAHLAHLPRAHHEQLHQPAARPPIHLARRHLVTVLRNHWVVREPSAKSDGHGNVGVRERAKRVGVRRGETLAKGDGVEYGEADMDDREKGVDEVGGESAASA